MSNVIDTNVLKLIVDHSKGNVQEYSKQDAETIIRNALIEANGGSDKIDYRSIRENGAKIFTVTEVILETLLQEGLTDQFDEFVDIRNVNLGDKNMFMVNDYHLFKVAQLSSGNNTLRRQRLDRTPFSVPTAWHGVKIYDELELFLAGRVDWAKMVAKVQKSFTAQITSDIYNAIVAGYTGLTTPYKVTGSYNETSFNTLVENIKAATGVQNVMVFGTKIALQNVVPAYVAYNGQVVEQRNQDGFFRVVDGIPLVEIRQAHIPGTDTLAVSDNFLLVVPQGEEQIVKLVLEGDPLIRETAANGMNADDSIEYLFKKKYGVGVITSSKYGAYTFS